MAFTSGAQAAGPPVNVSFPQTSASHNAVQDNFLGISFELSNFNMLWGETPRALPSAMKNYLHNIRARMFNPLRIRIGGNSMDGSKYAPSQESMIVFTDPNAYFNDVPVSFGPVLFDVLNGMADAVGELEYMIGLSMRFPHEFDNVVELAAASTGKLGSRLDALLLGNEPDLYAGHGERNNYTIQDYIPEVGQLIADMTNSPHGNLLNRTLLGGPTICCSWDLEEVLNAGLKDFPYKYYTLQRYPNHACSGVTERSSNISYYLTHSNVETFLRWNDAGMEVAKQNGVPVLLSEYNSVACGGDPNVSPTFASTLWAVDVALKAASLNFSGVYLHTREYGVTYNLFDPPNANAADADTLEDEDEAPSVTRLDYDWPPRGTAQDQLAQESALRPLQANWRTGAVYYAALVVAEAIASATSTVVDLGVDNTGVVGNATGGPDTVAAYAIYDNGVPSKLVLFNFDYPLLQSDSNPSAGDIPSSNTSRTFLLPSSLTSSQSVSVRYLTAANVTSHTKITWAGQRVGRNGQLEGEQETRELSCPAASSDGDGCVLEVDVPGPGLALVWLDPANQGDNIYVGNSTIIGFLENGARQGVTVAGGCMGMVVALAIVMLSTVL